MKISKTSKVWAAGIAAGGIGVGVGLMLIPIVGHGVGAVLITTGLATMGSLVGGGMFAGIGVIAAGSATAAAISGALAQKLIPDPELQDLARRLQMANELYAAAGEVTNQLKDEIDDLNRKTGEILSSKKKDQEQLESLKARLIVLIEQLRKQKGTEG